ncbi:MAG: enoyl-CoA hydratase/isomerase family protein [Acidimicrobiales bacterium]
MDNEVLYDEVGHVGLITLNRPEARNALTYDTYAQLEAAVRSTGARCLVITGSDPAFCSGDDVKQVMAGAGEKVSARLRSEPRLTPAADALLHTDVPVVAAVNGAAVGWGMELALMADIRVASERARFGELFVKRGLCCDVPASPASPAWWVGNAPPSCFSPAGSSTPARPPRSVWCHGSFPTTSSCRPQWSWPA